MAQPPIEVAAYYFPSYHRDATNDRWHGEGWTEWDLLRAARPRYPGHQQPKTPAWGEFDESDPAWAAKEIDLAADHGITSFIFDWYWHEKTGLYLHDALEKGFLAAPNRDRLKFCLMWANHDWNNIFPARLTNATETLAPGKVSPETFDTICDYVIDHYFSQPNHLRFDGKPVFSIYELGTFVASMGGVEGAARALDRFREKSLRRGFGGVHVNSVVWQLAILAGEMKIDDVNDVLRKLGVESSTTYAWVHHHNPSESGRPQASYADAAAANAKVWQHYADTLSVPYYPNVSMGWDPSPRTCQSDRFRVYWYPWTAILEGNTPAAFEASLRQAKAFVERLPADQRMVTLNAWNEWTEGSYLLPDTRHGLAYLEAVRRVFGASR